VLTDRGPILATIPHEKVPLSGVDNLIGASVSLAEDDSGAWFVDQVLGREALMDALGKFAAQAPPRMDEPGTGTRATLTIAENPFGLSQDWALLEFWPDDPTLAAGKLWARSNSDDGYASLTVASPAVAGEEADASQLILSKNVDGSQLATLIAEQIDLAAQTFHLGSLDSSSIDISLVGTSLFQIFSDVLAASTGYLNFNLGDGDHHTIAAFLSEGVRKALRLKAASIEFDDDEVGSVTTLAALLDRISDLEARVTDLESP
jgi:hypothetical protein